MHRRAFLLLVLAACRAPAPKATPAPPIVAFTDGMVTVDGKAFHLHCEGAGVPIIVFEGGSRGASYWFDDAFAKSAKYTRSCAFDQLGGGYSGPEPVPPRDAKVIADDTFHVLDAAGMEGPYVFVTYGKTGAQHGMKLKARHPANVVALLNAHEKTLPDVAPQLAQLVAIDQPLLVGTSTHAWTKTTTPDVRDELFEAAGTKLHLHCAGSGAPTVVMESGLGIGGEGWSSELPAVAKMSRVCTYDRPGRLYSPALPGTSLSDEKAETLRALLGKAGVRAPYLLVGHSLGAYIVELFAFQHPTEVAGLVLVDPTDAKSAQMSLDWMTPAQRTDFNSGMQDPPDRFDVLAFHRSNVEMRELSRPLDETPVVVLAHGQPRSFSLHTAEQNAALERASQEEYARIASSSTNGVVVTADNTGHMINNDQPALVVAAVREVLGAVRDHTRLNGPGVHAANAAPLPRPEW